MGVSDGDELVAVHCGTTGPVEVARHRRSTPGSDPADEVIDLLRRLRLPHMRSAAPELLATAKAQRWDPAEAIRALLTEELTGRQASSVRSRRKAAGFPSGKTFDGSLALSAVQGAAPGRG